MALITCSECNNAISDKAVACPSCGFSMNTPALEIPTAVARGKALLLVGSIFAIIVSLVALIVIDVFISGQESSLNVFGYLFFAFTLFFAAIMGIAKRKKTDKRSMQSVSWPVYISVGFWLSWAIPYTQNIFQSHGGIDFSIVLFIVPHFLLLGGASKNNKNV